MKITLNKKYPTVGCCGLDCGLCPTYNSTGNSKCPGCYGLDFSEKHPSCSIITCCVKQKNYEVCADCSDYPCSKIDKWDQGDSFISHKKALINLRSIKEGGIEAFIEQQKKRMVILNELLNQYNEGRSKSYYCIAVALLSIQILEEFLEKAKEEIKNNGINVLNIKAKSEIIKKYLNYASKKEGVELKLRK